jgi:hypothetical protein
VLDGACARALRLGGFTWRQLLAVPLKDVLFATAWAQGLLSDEVVWRGKRLRVLAGTRLERPELEEAGGGIAAEVA